MSTVAEIEEAIKTLPPEEVWKVGSLVDELRESLWDKRIDADIAAGKMDRLWEKAKADIAAGRVKPLDEVLNDE